MDEFSLIDTYFKSLGDVAGRASPDVVLGIGDDCALLAPRPGCELAVTADTLVAGVHFLEDTHAVDLGFKALAVNLSDLAAMGAEPAWFTLCLTLPENDEPWIRGFTQGVAILADEYQVPLVGGDTTRGPLAVSVQVAGWVPAGKALRRSGARVGDGLYVSGELGWPGLGLNHLLGRTLLPGKQQLFALDHLLRPQPQVQLGIALRDYASACIDISDGLTADLGHILAASGVGASLDLAALPVAEPLCSYQANEPEKLLDALNFGDEYQLLFTAPDPAHSALTRAAETAGARISMIGRITDSGRLTDAQGNPLTAKGYQHFS